MYACGASVCVCVCVYMYVEAGECLSTLRLFNKYPFGIPICGASVCVCICICMYVSVCGMCMRECVNASICVRGV